MAPTPEVLAIAPAIIRAYGLSFLLLPLNIFSTYYFQAVMRPAAAFIVSAARGAVIIRNILFQTFGEEARMEQEHLPDGSVEAFRAVSKEFDSVYSIFAKNCGLSDAEFWYLLMLRCGFTTQSEISGQLLVSRQTVNSAFKLLVKKGLVRLEPLEHNQRTRQALSEEKNNPRSEAKSR